MENKKGLMIAGIVLGIVIILGSFIIVLLGALSSAKENLESKAAKNENKEQIIVPDVVGLKKDEAISLLEKDGLKATVSFVNNEKVGTNVVVKSLPNKNVEVSKGSEVVIYVSLGGSKVLIDDYKNQSIYVIKSGLEAQGIRVSVEEKNDTNEIDNKKIVDQSVEPGEYLDEGDSIILYIPSSRNN